MGKTDDVESSGISGLVRDLTSYDKKLILDLAGHSQNLCWGAAMSVAVSFLHRKGVLTGAPNYRLTPLGHKIAEHLIGESEWDSESTRMMK